VELNVPVAVKILRPEVTTMLGQQRFRREIDILKQLDHPNVLPLLDSGSTEGGDLYLSTPFIAGETLRTRLRREKRMEVRDAIAIARDVAAALDYAHERGLIHRDIKPANILLSEGRVIVADFGISRPMTPSQQSAPITVSGVSLGTPEYMSPEQISGELELDARSDIYALGCVMYEMLSGKPPFTGPFARVFVSHCNEQPRSLRDAKLPIPAAVEAAVTKSLAKNRESRFATAGEFARAL
jgi:serine/threonine-protein kinase